MTFAPKLLLFLLGDIVWVLKFVALFNFGLDLLKWIVLDDEGEGVERTRSFLDGFLIKFLKRINSTEKIKRFLFKTFFW
jgi:hypothetical protein